MIASIAPSLPVDVPSPSRELGPVPVSGVQADYLSALLFLDRDATYADIGVVVGVCRQAVGQQLMHIRARFGVNTTRELRVAAEQRGWHVVDARDLGEILEQMTRAEDPGRQPVCLRRAKAISDVEPAASATVSGITVTVRLLEFPSSWGTGYVGTAMRQPAGNGNGADGADALMITQTVDAHPTRYAALAALGHTVRDVPKGPARWALTHALNIACRRITARRVDAA